MATDQVIQFSAGTALPGVVRKKLTVPQDRVALLVEGSEVLGQRKQGDYGLSNWPRSAPDVALLPTQPFEMRPRVRGLKDGKDQELDLVWPVTVQVTDPARFYKGWLAKAAGPQLALVDLEDDLSGRLWEGVEERVRRYELADLKSVDKVQLDLNRDLRPALSSLLSDLGLALVGSERPQARTLDDERGLQEQLTQQEQAARDARFNALFERLQDKEMLDHRLRELAQQRGDAPPGTEVVDAMWAVVEKGPQEAAQRAQRASQVLSDKLAALNRTLETERSQNERRFHQLVARMEATEKVAAKVEAEEADPIRLLKRFLLVLRLVGSALSAGAMLIALFAPQLAEQIPPVKLQLGALIVSIVVGVLTFVSDYLLRGRVRRMQTASDAKKRLDSRAGLEQRRHLDGMVRARVEAGLKQVADSLDASWKKGFGAGGAARDLAVPLREVARGIRDYGEHDVRNANYDAGRYLATDNVPDVALAAVLDLDEELLDRSQTLAQMAEGLYEQVNAGNADVAKGALREIENGFNALRNRFTERGAYLMNQA